jgi:uncharacterized membrane protein YdjX (TVP38/TMEM64 family)
LRVALSRALLRPELRFGLFLLFLISTIMLAYWRARGGMPLTAEAVREAVMAWGALAPVIFIGFFALRPFLLFPTVLLFMGGGLVFGALWGTLYAAVGGTLGAVVTFAVARALGREFVQARIRNRFPRLDEQRWGPGLVFVLNLVPIVPITAINYGAGLSRIRIAPFVMAVVAGLTPRAFAYTFFGSSLEEIGSTRFVLAILLLVGLVAVPTLLRRRLLRPSADTRRSAD